MRERGKATLNLAGSLLLAHPAMRDPNFRRAVVLLSAHGDDGAMGVVLNRPLGKQLGDLNAQFAASPLAGVPVYQGGPVQTEQLILAAWQPEPLETGFRFYFGIDVDKAETLQGGGGRAPAGVSRLFGLVEGPARKRVAPQHVGDHAGESRTARAATKGRVSGARFWVA